MEKAEERIEEPRQERKSISRVLQMIFFGSAFLQVLFWPVPWLIITLVLLALGGIIAAIGLFFLAVLLIVGMAAIAVVVLPFSLILTILGLILAIFPAILFGLYQLHLYLYSLNPIAGIVISIALYLFIGLFLYKSDILRISLSTKLQE